MTQHANDRITLSANGANLIRIMIASYFLAVAVGIVPGTDLSALFGAILPDPWAGRLGSALVFGLAYMVLVGTWLRGAALLLAILLFWSSYIAMAQMGLADRVGSFWRDLALIGALIMTYAETDPRNSSRRGPFRKVLEARRIYPGDRVAPRRIGAASDPALPIIPFRPTSIGPGRRAAMSVRDEPEINVFRDDFDVARLS